MKRLASVTLVVLACVAMVVLMLIQGTKNWQVAVKPLSVEEIRGFEPATAGSTQDGLERQVIDEDKPGPSAGAQSGLPERDATGEAKRPTNDVAAGEAVERGGNGLANSTGTSDAVEDLERHSPPQGQRVARPSEEQLLRRFRQYTGSERARRKTELLVSEILGTSIYRVRQGATDAWTRSIPGQVGRQFVHVADFDKARNYLREAVRVEKNEPWRRYLCAQLAWLEEDPQVAVALLEESCAGPLGEVEDTSFFDAYAEFNALDFAVATGSEELAEHYFRRYRDSWPQWIRDNRRPWFPETMTWLEEHMGMPE